LRRGVTIVKDLARRTKPGRSDFLLSFCARELSQQFLTVGDVQSIQLFQLPKEFYGVGWIMSIPAELGHNLALASKVPAALGNVPLGLLQALAEHSGTEGMVNHTT